MTNYREEFEQRVTLFLSDFESNRGKRIALINEMINDYVTKYSEAPPSSQLERLADAIMDEEINDRHPDKMSRSEYPIMSQRQLDRRYEREYSLDLAENYDVTGKNYGKPERRHRIAKEQRFIDRTSQQKNRARNAQYKRDTSPGPIVAYNLRDTGGVLADEFVSSREINFRAIPEYYR